MASFSERWRNRLRTRFILILEIIGYAICLTIAAGAAASWFVFVDLEETLPLTLRLKGNAVAATQPLVLESIDVESFAELDAGDAVLTVREAPLAVVLQRMREALQESAVSLEEQALDAPNAALLEEVQGAFVSWEQRASALGGITRTIPAPEAGTILLAQKLAAGLALGKGEALFTMLDPSSLTGEAHAGAEILDRLGNGDSVRALLAGDKLVKLQGRITALQPEAEKLLVEFPAIPDELRSQLLNALHVDPGASLSATVTVVTGRIRLFQTIFNRD